ncbi:RidA family protein [Bradyrhizobium sp. JYMT SZCCT0428]|uniref:RidA family protein n=1 Tax=Bradyrhizobium sp. JYMT SZCCT0428 TaxID=2807673 RepID=UPI00201107D9|nr:Rid family hydrolase [Bradyrhizobium sp. JYMT SZCCT0428]
MSMNDKEILLAIQKLLDGKQWHTETVDQIAMIVERAGYPIRTWGETPFPACPEPAAAGSHMKSRVETLTPPNTPKPIGPYNHIAKVGQHISIGGTAGVDPATGQLAGADVGAQTRQILKSFVVMLEAVGSDLSHVTHINIFLQQMSDFEAMNGAYVEIMGDLRPARTVIAVQELPKPGALLTMNLTAVTREG